MLEEKKNNLKIYFSGSVRGGREDSAIYAKIISYLKNYGEVITEYLGDINMHSEGEIEKTDNFVYERDIKWIESADVLVAEVTTPSLGVGYEVCYAEKFSKKILCLYRKTNGKRLSNMISGNKNLEVIIYKEEEFSDIIKNFFEK